MVEQRNSKQQRASSRRTLLRLSSLSSDYILRQSVDTINSKGLTIEPRRSKRHEAKHLTDLDYADDLVLTANQLKLKHKLKHFFPHWKRLLEKWVYAKCQKDRMYDSQCRFASSTYKYLGSHLADSRKDFLSRKGLAWTA